MKMTEELSFTFGAEVVAKFLHQHNLDLICRAHQVVENGMNFLQRGSWSLCLLQLIIVESLTMEVPC